MLFTSTFPLFLYTYLLWIQFCLFIQLFHLTDDLQLVQFDFFSCVDFVWLSRKLKKKMWAKRKPKPWVAQSIVGSADPEAHRKNVNSAWASMDWD